MARSCPTPSILAPARAAPAITTPSAPGDGLASLPPPRPSLGPSPPSRSHAPLPAPAPENLAAYSQLPRLPAPPVSPAGTVSRLPPPPSRGLQAIESVDPITLTRSPIPPPQHQSPASAPQCPSPDISSLHTVDGATGAPPIGPPDNIAPPLQISSSWCAPASVRPPLPDLLSSTASVSPGRPHTALHQQATPEAPARLPLPLPDLLSCRRASPIFSGHRAGSNSLPSVFKKVAMPTYGNGKSFAGAMRY
ncbi:hypothetical protein U9M48_041399, partial [Paspalum notatum var. saurae]